MGDNFQTTRLVSTKPLKRAVKAEHDAVKETELSRLSPSLTEETKKLTTDRSGIPPLCQNGSWHSTLQEKFDVFSNLLCKQFTPFSPSNNESTEPVQEHLNQHPLLSPFSISLACTSPLQLQGRHY